MEQTDTALGIIYLLTNDKKSWTKIGRTSTGTAEGRAISYGKVHGHKWTVVEQLATLRVGEVEANIHAALFPRRVDTDTKAREIFNIRPDAALQIARSMLVPPTGSRAEQQAAIARHAAKVRRRLEAQASFVGDRANRSRSVLSTGRNDTIRRLVAPQLLSIDAWEAGISEGEMLARYRVTLACRNAERARLKALAADYEHRLTAAYNTARKAQSWWDMLKDKPLKHLDQVGPRPSSELDATRFPNVPEYAAILIYHEQHRELQKAERDKLVVQDATKAKRC